MNKQEAIEKVKEHGEFYSNAFGGTVKMVPVGPIIDTISQIDEPQKPVIPKFVADFYESIKDNFEYNVYNLCLQFPQFTRDDGELSSEVCGWFDSGKNELIQTLVKTKLYCHEIEQEKLYTVEIPNPNNEYCMNALIRLPFGKIALVALHRPNTSYLKNKEHQLTEAEIKKDFEWAWDAGFAKEVE